MLVDRAAAYQTGAPDWKFGAVRPYTVAVAFSRADRRVLVVATLAVVLAGLLLAGVLLFATGQSTPPGKYKPFAAGNATAIRNDLKSGGPYFFPDPFGGSRNILLALEHGQIVALSTILPETTDCEVKWKGSVDHFVDCHGDRLDSEALARYETSIPEGGPQKGLLLIDLRKKLPAPQPA